ncbi:hypothetical protein HBH70_209040 [Parastagonospora nodorum]|uniref:Uncharacterized protein n=1 Tax=Phaeosphaeria nodorum (strain SN15 / ATCC MYA-4574 / FGSC 10173) TaxID=321614 RepID=A0A7U2HZ52_PHANO|nr:hypothetical protein HBH53_174910 [Parastagonospora nodorum]QRC96013.1 hypothetical protein JI435_408190 [Parastagonospora nodorum SN15]KAH4198226.1 hypothetical protein HBI95_186100 [Parastagonospora nodorum]KAH4231548.1 hypothetical protein HBI05_180550 [Parastagonospora nodorum]KAH4559994.1 hypothetical protein HBH84_203000 [Parastagonospora nodorum]
MWMGYICHASSVCICVCITNPRTVMITAHVYLASTKRVLNTFSMYFFLFQIKTWYLS